MSDQYHLDLANYSLETFKEMLRTKTLVPSRACLKDNMDERIRQIQHAGITTVEELLGTLKTKPRLQRFAQDTGLSEEYLTLLKREVNSYLPNPVRLDKFPGIPQICIAKLDKIGLKNSRQLFTHAKQKQQRIQLVRSTDIPPRELNELICLADLVRVYGVGPMFARLLYDAGIRTVKILRSVSAEKLICIYEKNTGKKADFGVSEIQFSIDIASSLDTVLEI